MPLVYRTNAPEKPRPLPARPKDDEPLEEDALDWKPRIFSVTSKQFLDESPGYPATYDGCRIITGE
jgi:hypothetical protein